jgi:hypothetical protein
MKKKLRMVDTLRSMKEETKPLKEFSVEEALSILSLYTKTGSSNGYLDFDPSRMAEAQKLKILLEKEGLTVFLSSKTLEVYW